MGGRGQREGQQGNLESEFRSPKLFEGWNFLLKRLRSLEGLNCDLTLIFEQYHIIII